MTEQLIEKLAQCETLNLSQLEYLIAHFQEVNQEELCCRARKVREEVYGKAVYIRGLIEFTNFCKNDCYYCGIRRSNKNAPRYRLTEAEIMECCGIGYDLGFRTFVLQGGEDVWYTDERMTGIIRQIRNMYTDCAITLSMGERSRESYEAFFNAGANRYLLRHETADEEHYKKLHPKELSWQNRMECLKNLKEIGFQTGTGFMVGSPGQTAKILAKDLAFIQEFQPQMVGIGPYLSHHETPFAAMENGSMELTLFLLAILRLMLPKVLLPSTTALGTIHPEGREKGILAGANVVMPNLSPLQVREKYLLYDNKICTGDEAAESRKNIEKRMEAIGYYIETARGDYPL